MVILLFGKVPSNSLENIEEAVEYIDELKIYRLAIRSIETGMLKAKKKNGEMYDYTFWCKIFREFDTTPYSERYKRNRS